MMLLCLLHPSSDLQLLLVRTPCPRYYEELHKILKDKEPQEIISKYKEVFENLTTITGDKVEDPEDAQNLYSTLLAEVQKSDF